MGLDYNNDNYYYYYYHALHYYPIPYIMFVLIPHNYTVIMKWIILLLIGLSTKMNGIQKESHQYLY